MSSDELRDAIAGALYVRDRFDSPTVVLADAILALPEMQAMLAEIARLRAEIVRLRALVDDYENGINWHTTCTNCAKLMDVNYDQYCEIDRLRAAGDQLADYVREAGPGLHDDMAILACWQEARRG